MPVDCEWAYKADDDDDDDDDSFELVHFEQTENK